MACLPVTYALCWLVMALSVSEAKEETKTFTLNPNREITEVADPQSGNSKNVQEGTNVTLICPIAWEAIVDVLWYRTYGAPEQYRHFVQCHSAVFSDSVKISQKKYFDGKGSCFNNSYGLMIQNIDKQNEARWYCLVNNKWQSPYVEIKVDMHNGSTSQRISSPTTTMVKDVTLTSKSTKGTTEYTTERTDNESASINTLVPLIGGAAGGAFVLLALVITGCVLYRSRREVNKPNDEQASTTDSNRDPGANVEEAVVMEGNLMYGSCGAGNDDYAQIPCREPASASHEKEDASVMKNQPDTEDGNTNQSGVDSGDIYAIPDKPKKSTVEDVEDVYSQVQKPMKGIE
ncbi:uncharacterized protein LOC124118999 isoform X2 [Haliotis rufescens]|uniref:uncharacterized protein LOC124119002 isoform X2 n=1 Tax=Haliotis rufescens TaxID=6454 RepID=UPI00201EDB6D|nr:uncharacterized protein LOC124119002 isoform X2 [Haliotis rufescens]XP_048249937.1 uncharacterized protein LOC124118999 isoform X2 [Haliotis rufescens]